MNNELCMWLEQKCVEAKENYWCTVKKAKQRTIGSNRNRWPMPIDWITYWISEWSALYRFEIRPKRFDTGCTQCIHDYSGICIEFCGASQCRFFLHFSKHIISEYNFNYAVRLWSIRPGETLKSLSNEWLLTAESDTLVLLAERVCKTFRLVFHHHNFLSFFFVASSLHNRSVAQ